MIDPKNFPRTEPEYEIEPHNRFMAALASINAYELSQPGNTVTFLSEVDLSEVESMRNLAGKVGQRKPSYTAFVIKAVALAIRMFPYANRRVTRSIFGWSQRVQKFRNIDAAVMIERELPEAPMAAFVDMIRNADQMPLTKLTEELHALAISDVGTNQQWRNFSWIIRRLPGWLARWIIRMPALSSALWVRYRGGAFVVSSPAKYGVDAIMTIWPWPLGVSFGLVKERAVVRNGQIVARPTFMLTLNFDRRLMAGAQAARFFKRVIDCLENAGAEMASELKETEVEVAVSPSDDPNSRS
jgi:pyruvate/2-oxoglutarate dehydrogenase complex dihydrolipoamide acyltransferase (E2) component